MTGLAQEIAQRPALIATEQAQLVHREQQRAGLQP
jgi:hypothetical protein